MNKWIAWIALCLWLLHASKVENQQMPSNQRYRNIPNKEIILPSEEIVKNDVLFTIDDGPSIYMSEIAKTLDSLHYEWIFFVVTRGINERTKNTLLEVLKQWHHIGNHSFSHPNFQTLSIEEAKQQILIGDSLIANIYKQADIPREKKYIRFPYGNLPPKSYRDEFYAFLDSLWYEKPMYWRMDVLLNDCSNTPTDERIVKMKKNDTILMHERSWTAETIRKIVKSLEEKE